MNKKDCEVEGCNGIYETKTIYYINRHKRGTDEYQVSIEDYNKLKDTKGHHAVISTYCNKCNDDLNNRLINMTNSHY